MCLLALVFDYILQLELVLLHVSRGGGEGYQTKHEHPILGLTSVWYTLGLVEVLLRFRCSRLIRILLTLSMTMLIWLLYLYLLKVSEKTLLDIFYTHHLVVLCVVCFTLQGHMMDPKFGQVELHVSDHVSTWPHHQWPWLSVIHCNRLWWRRVHIHQSAVAKANSI